MTIHRQAHLQRKANKVVLDRDLVQDQVQDRLLAVSQELRLRLVLVDLEPAPLVLLDQSADQSEDPSVDQLEDLLADQLVAPLEDL